MARAGRGGKGRGRRKTASKGAATGAVPRPHEAREAAARRPPDPWARLTLIVLVAVLALRLGVNALEPFPVHFKEAAFWARGQALALGYVAEPPLAAWLVRGVTEGLGDTLFALRLPSAVAHAAVAWLVFLTGRRLWDGRTGFWAAAGYTAAPGVGLSAMLLTAEPVVMLLWAGALYALVRAGEAGGRLWWAVLGALIGAGALAGYSMAAFVVGALGYGLFSARARDWRGAGLAALAALAVFAPNLWWNLGHGLVTLRQTAEAVAPAGGAHPWALAGFLAVQVGLIGPVFLGAILVALRNRGFWRDEPGMRLMAWQTLPLIAALAALALAGRAPAVWAAPAYLGGALMAARWLVLAGGLPALRAQLAVGVAASLVLWSLAGLYAGQAESLTRRLDLYAATRLSEPFCGLALSVMAEEGAEALLSDDPRRLAECMFYGSLGWGEVAIWNPDGRVETQAELVASLGPGDDRAMLLAVTHGAEEMTARFEEAREIESGRLATHLDRWVPFSLWVVRGFRGYR